MAADTGAPPLDGPADDSGAVEYLEPNVPEGVRVPYIPKGSASFITERDTAPYRRVAKGDELFFTADGIPQDGPTEAELQFLSPIERVLQNDPTLGPLQLLLASVNVPPSIPTSQETTIRYWLGNLTQRLP